MTMREGEDRPFAFRGQLERLKMILDPGEVREGAGPWKTWKKTGEGEYQTNVAEMGE